VKDDVERTLRYWHRDRIVLRFADYACRKKHRPGIFSRSKGGISTGLDEQVHRTEGFEALSRMAAGFARPYVRLPTGGDQERDPMTGAPLFLADGRVRWRSAGRYGVSGCGVVFCGRALARSSADLQPGKKLQVGFSCWACRRASGRAGAEDDGCSMCVRPLVQAARSEFFDEGRRAVGTHKKQQNYDHMVQQNTICLESEWAMTSADERQPYKDAAAVRLHTQQWVSMDVKRRRV